MLNKCSSQGLLSFPQVFENSEGSRFLHEVAGLMMFKAPKVFGARWVEPEFGPCSDGARDTRQYLQRPSCVELPVLAGDRLDFVVVPSLSLSAQSPLLGPGSW